MSELYELRDQLRQFTEERDWGQFHDAKNLSMALAAEAGELLEVFQWLTPEEARRIGEQPDEVSRAAEEVADIMIYVVRLADVLG
jgi:dCTP diphosphatase